MLFRTCAPAKRRALLSVLSTFIVRGTRRCGACDSMFSTCDLRAWSCAEPTCLNTKDRDSQCGRQSWRAIPSAWRWPSLKPQCNCRLFLASAGAMHKHRSKSKVVRHSQARLRLPFWSTMIPPGARGGAAAAAARYESAQKCWRWPARNPADGDGPDRPPCTWQSFLPPSRRGPCPGGRGEGALRS